MPTYVPAPTRYDTQNIYARTGNSGLLLPKISLGLWHNFGGVDALENQRALVRRAFDLGITHLDLANNYGPPAGSAEENFGRLLKEDLAAHRDELIVSTKAGYRMWPGPYGDFGSKKYLTASLDQSLKRMGLDYVDIFYHHRPDPSTPLEESMGALAQIVRAGKALYVGISSYSAEQTAAAAKVLKGLGVQPLIHQPCYHMFDRWIEGGLLDTLKTEGMGAIVYCPLAQGLLTDRYLTEIPADSRAAKSHGYLKANKVTPEARATLVALNAIAQARGQSLAQMALTWVLRDSRVTSALIGASKVSQIEHNMEALKAAPLSSQELAAIEAILAKPGAIPSIW
jgi:L-glyceraldehyde 3-phosphate reductase